ncbi:MAG: preprotein translocase subunit SecA [Porticoccaceae bacterium]
MVGSLFKKLFGSKNDRELRRYNKLVKAVNQLEDDISGLDEAALKAKTLEFRERVVGGETLEQLMPEAFAVVREAARRALGLRHFDVQLIGGAVLHEGKIAEMRTGEGKTLVATLPAYLNSLTGKGVHIITVNDYLAHRDAQWMGPVFHTLGLTVGSIQSFAGPGTPNSFVYDVDSDASKKMRPANRREAYAADITYGTNNEFGFDYLRDNMALSLEEKGQRELSFAIVDEVDSILIDEARTPLIISGASQDSSELYKKINVLVQKLTRQLEGVKEGLDELLDSGSDSDSESDSGHFILDEQTRQVELTETGHETVEALLVKDGLLEPDDNLYQPANLGLLHHIHNALRAHHLFHRDVEYMMQNDEVVLIDEHTGRTMSGRRLSEGLHQAIEAKEGVDIQSESQTMASTTFQNYFRLYDKLAGMTGTADTEAYEFQQIYGLPVVVIPTNTKVTREDLNDLIFQSEAEKYAAVVEDIESCISKGAPVLVGTASIEGSERLSNLLTKKAIQHKVLNAKFHEQEALIVAQAGQPGALTIATNMAGRGTDIVLGGNWEFEVEGLKNPSDTQIKHIKDAWQLRHDAVITAGGLHILGTERHESRRIDNQLRGRSGRQGDPGVTRFYLSMEDNLMRLFISDRVKSMMGAIGLENGEAIEHRMVSNAVEKAQRKVEGRNFDIRKQLLEYDDVANDQRSVIYQQRDQLLEAETISDVIETMRIDVVNDSISAFIPPQSLPEQWDVAGLEGELKHEFRVELPLVKWLKEDERLHEDGLREKIMLAVNEAYVDKSREVGPDIHMLEKQVMLQVLDNLWKEHLSNMDHLRQGIGLRAYGQKNPKQEYKRESFDLFQEMLGNIKRETVRFLSRVQVRNENEVEELERQRRALQAAQQKQMQFQHDQANNALSDQSSGTPNQPGAFAPEPFVRDGHKVGRNQPCPCGSGKKYKQCHGQLG